MRPELQHEAGSVLEDERRVSAAATTAATKKKSTQKKMAWTNVSTAKHVGTARVLHRGGCNVVPVVLVRLSSGRCFRLLCGYGVRFEGNGQMGERHHHHRHHPEIKRRKSEWPFRGGTQMRTFHGKYWGKQRYLQRSRRR